MCKKNNANDLSKMININFDFQAEVNGRKQGDAQPYKLVYGSDGAALDWHRETDSDRYSSTLQEYHRILWSKPLPNGKMFDLVKISQNRLHHASDLGEFILSSDRATSVTFAKNKCLLEVISKLPPDTLAAFSKLSDSIGGIIIWPAKRMRGPTINQARGFGRTGRMLADRLDLTVECVRRYYLREPSPLNEVFERYSDFFRLFVDFRGWVNFFLLQDMVDDDYIAVKIAPPFNNFHTPSVPRNVEEYTLYMEHTVDLIRKRNARIDVWQSSTQAG